MLTSLADVCPDCLEMVCLSVSKNIRFPRTTAVLDMVCHKSDSQSVSSSHTYTVSMPRNSKMVGY